MEFRIATSSKGGARSPNPMISVWRETLGRVGDLDAAGSTFTEAHTLFANVGDRSNLARADKIEGEVLVRVGREAEGAAMIGRGLERCDSLGALGAERPEHLAAKSVARIKRQMGEAQGEN